MKYCQLNNGDVLNVWSDNEDEKTMLVYPLDLNFDAEVDVAELVDYKDIKKTSDQLSDLK